MKTYSKHLSIQKTRVNTCWCCSCFFEWKFTTLVLLTAKVFFPSSVFPHKPLKYFMIVAHRPTGFCWRSTSLNRNRNSWRIARYNQMSRALIDLNSRRKSLVFLFTRLLHCYAQADCFFCTLNNLNFAPSQMNKQFNNFEEIIFFATPHSTGTIFNS